MEDPRRGYDTGAVLQVRIVSVMAGAVTFNLSRRIVESCATLATGEVCSG